MERPHSKKTGNPFNTYIGRSKALPYDFPVDANRLESMALIFAHEEITTHAEAVRPIVHESVVDLARAFLDFKKEHGSKVEQALYKDMDLATFFDKLIRKRPLMFMTANDEYILRDGKTAGEGGFELIGTDQQQAPLVLAEYNSYDEMQIAALMVVSVPTHFINSGNRHNLGIPGESGSYEPSGVHTGLVGARFERKRLMEWQHLIIDREQNTAENGYGPQADPEAVSTKSLAHWARFYGEGNGERFFFPDYETVKADTSGNFIKPTPFASYYLNCRAYKRRMRAIAEPFLIDANERAKAAGTQAYVLAVGFGIGVWAIDRLKEKQAALIVEAFEDVIAGNEFPHIADLVFSWYPDNCTHCGGAGNGEVLQSGGNQIRIHFNKHDPIQKLVGPDEGKLLVASYAWDGNSYPGNEYWKGALAASGDPAAACCSNISELQNPDVNPFLKGDRTHVAVTGSGLRVL